MITLLLVGHFVGDFLLQTRRMFAEKTTSGAMLIAHCGVYSATIVFFGCLSSLINVGDPPLAFLFLQCFFSHIIIDYNLGRIMEKSLKQYDYSMFFGLIGFDQLIHILVIVNSI